MDLIGRIYVGALRGPLYIAIHTNKYISCGPHGFIEDFFYDFFLLQSLEVIDPRLDLRGLIGRIYVVEHKMLLHTI